MPNRLTEEQLEALVQDYQRPLLVFATRLLQDPQDAEEVVNDVFLNAGMHADLSRGTVALRRWMYTITRIDAEFGLVRVSRHQNVEQELRLRCVLDVNAGLHILG